MFSREMSHIPFWPHTQLLANSQYISLRILPRPWTVSAGQSMNLLVTFASALFFINSSLYSLVLLSVNDCFILLPVSPSTMTLFSHRFAVSTPG